MGQDPSAASTNPFATRFVEPGKLPFVAYDKVNEGIQFELPKQFINSLESNQFRGAIVGQHGTGKSTLLSHLKVFLLEKNFQVEPCSPTTINNDTNWKKSIKATTQSIVLLIDGFEQINKTQQSSIHEWCKEFSIGLIVTTHEHCCVPTAFETSATVEILCALASHLLASAKLESRIQPKQLEQIFKESNGNIRESLFLLYDWFEQGNR